MSVHFHNIPYHQVSTRPFFFKLFYRNCLHPDDKPEILTTKLLVTVSMLLTSYP